MYGTGTIRNNRVSTIRNNRVSTTRLGPLKLLPPGDSKPRVLLDETNTPHLHIVRKGRKQKLHISRRVAEELIAAGINSLK